MFTSFGQSYVLPEPAKKEEKVKISRGAYSLVLDVVTQNFMFLFGSKPGFGVVENTKLIKDVMRSFGELYCKETLTVQFPDILDQL